MKPKFTEKFNNLYENSTLHDKLSKRLNCEKINEKN